MFGAKHLRCLGLPKSFSGNGVGDGLRFGIDSLHGGADRGCEDSCARSIRHFDDLIERLLAQARPCRVVDSHQANPRFHPLERVAHTLIPFVSTDDYLNAEHRQVAREFLLNHRFVFGRDGHDDLSHTWMVGKKLCAILPDRFALDGGVDFFLKGVVESGAFAGSGQDDSNVFHGFRGY